MDDELVILGSGGGRHHIRTQHRATGGILFKFNGNQAHLDPGPGATVRINQFGHDPTKTNLFIVTHVHLDHFSDLAAIIEASRVNFHDRHYNYQKKGTLLTTQEVVSFLSDYHKNMLEEIIIFNPEDSYTFDGVKIKGTKVIHSDVQGFGIKFYLKEYTIGFTSDTCVFEGFSEQFSDLDVLVLNLLRPDSVTCKRHLCTDEVIPYLNKIERTLKGLIITHFGSFMDGPRSEKNFVPSQVAKIISQTSIKKVIGAEDGMQISIQNLLRS